MERGYMYRTHCILFDGIYAVPSEYLLGLYDKQYDLRYRFFYCDDAQNRFLIGMLGFFAMENIPGISPYAGDYYSYAPNTAEMKLIIAECQARQGDYVTAMQTLNDFRRYRIDNSAPTENVSLTAQDKESAIELILEERAMEFPFSRRWNDIRRCNFNEDPSDDITVVRKGFYTVGKDDVSDALSDYTLTPESLSGYAFAIPDPISTFSGTLLPSRTAVPDFRKCRLRSRRIPFLFCMPLHSDSWL